MSVRTQLYVRMSVRTQLYVRMSVRTYVRTYAAGTEQAVALSEITFIKNALL